MKKIFFFISTILLFSCSSDNDELIKQATITFKFTQNWDGTTFSKSDFGKTEFTNKLGTKLKIEKLRYLVSRFAFTDGKGNVTLHKGYKLVDVNDEGSLALQLPNTISEGSYNLSFIFGFNTEDNKDAIYKDLNTASWSVPSALGGGYHFMQLEGKFNNSKNEEQGFAYHTINAYDTSTNTPENTFFSVDLGSIVITNNATIEIKMNIAEWFKNPNDWDLNTLNSMLMPNFDAQKQMSANGKSGAFKLGSITQ